MDVIGFQYRFELFGGLSIAIEDNMRRKMLPLLSKKHREITCLLRHPKAVGVGRHAAPVLVQCHAGRSRSAVVVAGYLIAERGLLPEEALALVAAKREIAVTSGLE